MISRSVGFKQTQHLKECGRDFVEIQFGFDVEDGIEIGRGQAGAGEGIQFGSQLRDVRRRHGEAAGVGVSAVAGEKTAAGFDSFEQMKGANGAAGTEGFFAFAAR